MIAATGTTTTPRVARPQRSAAANASPSPALASSANSGWTVVWIGWARIPYGARNR